MRKVCIAIALMVIASGARADTSTAVFMGLNYDPVVQAATRHQGLISGDGPLLPLIPLARACFERPAAQALIRFTEGLSVDAVRNLPISSVLLDAWLRTTCPITTDSI